MVVGVGCEACLWASELCVLLYLGSWPSFGVVEVVEVVAVDRLDAHPRSHHQGYC